jgi:hypothetical protein
MDNDEVIVGITEITPENQSALLKIALEMSRRDCAICNQYLIPYCRCLKCAKDVCEDCTAVKEVPCVCKECVDKKI